MVKVMGTQRTYDPEERYKACLYYFVYQSWGRVAKKLDIPVATIRVWSKTEWWHEYTNQLKSKYQSKLDSRFTYILDRMTAEIMDRLEKGDYKFDTKTGRNVRVPPTLRDLSTALGTIHDKRAMVRGEPTSRSEKVDKGKRLQKLQEQFEKFQTPKSEKEDAEKVH
jgi:hypothetical protein